MVKISNQTMYLQAIVNEIKIDQDSIHYANLS